MLRICRAAFGRLLPLSSLPSAFLQRQRPKRRRLLASSLVVLSVWIAAPSAANTLFAVDSAFSSLGVANASFDATGSLFTSTLEPIPGTDWMRSVSGTLTLDDTGALVEANLQLLGAPLIGDQVRLNPRGDPIDLGDFTLTAMAVSIDASGFADMTGGTVEFDLSLGSTRVSSPFPFALAGCCAQAQATNTGGAPIVTPLPGGAVALLPVLITFDDLTVISGGATSFVVFGVIQATEVPEVSTFTMLTVGLLALVGRGRRTAR